MVGYNWQLNNWVAGVEGDFSWVSKHGISNSIPPFNIVGSNATREHWLGTGRVRLGVIPVDGRLFYVTGGFAAAGVEAIFQLVRRNVTLNDDLVRVGHNYKFN